MVRCLKVYTIRKQLSKIAIFQELKKSLKFKKVIYFSSIPTWINGTFSQKDLDQIFSFPQVLKLKMKKYVHFILVKGDFFEPFNFEIGSFVWGLNITSMKGYGSNIIGSTLS